MFREGLAKLGWTEGRNLQLVPRFSGGDPGRLAADAQELVNIAPDVIFVFGGPAARAVQARTQTIPIVFVGGGDPQANNLVGSIARPSGNLTGFGNTFTSLNGKWLELFKEAVPSLTRIADAFDPDRFQNSGPARREVAAAAAQLGLTTIEMPIRDPADIERRLDAFAAEPNGGLLLSGPPLSAGKVEAIQRLALRHRLPAMYGGIRITGEGVLLSHGADGADLFLRASSYVDRILRGAKPGDLPVQYPTKFALTVNLKTAKAIGVAIPDSFLARADEVIE